MNNLVKEKGGTFSLNKSEPIHRWYSYVEGYSSCLITEELNRLISMNPHIQAVYDPFCGTGTTALVGLTMVLILFLMICILIVIQILLTATKKSSRRFLLKWIIKHITI